MAKYLYNGVLLPEIPADVLAQYPYAWISTDAAWLNVSKVPWFNKNNYLSFGSITAENRAYKISSTGEEWELKHTFTDNGGNTANVLWSNYDIPNGSADSTDIYFYGSEPVDPNAPEEPEVFYKISGMRLTAIADQVRRISGVTDELTPEQMETNLLNVEIPEDLLNAEEAAFGLSTGDFETGIVALGSSYAATNNKWHTLGWKFTAAEAFTIVGFRQKHSNEYSKKMTLWDSLGNSIKSITTADQATDWIEYYFDSPVNVAIGETYTVSVYTANFSYSYPTDTTFNGKLSDVQLVSVNNKDAFPTGSTSSLYNIDIIMAPVQAELPESYEIQRSTMDDIAEEIQRITGATTKLNTTQIVDALEGVVLQEKTVTPTDAEQTITADDGYFGLASVIVEAAEGGGIPENARLYYVGYANSVNNFSNSVSSAVGELTE